MALFPKVLSHTRHFMFVFYMCDVIGYSGYKFSSRTYPLLTTFLTLYQINNVLVSTIDLLPNFILLLPLQKVLGQFLGIVGMALAEYDLPTKPTNIGRFHLGFLGICQQEVISTKDCWQYWYTLAFKIGRLGNLPNQSLLSVDFSTFLPRNVGKIGDI